MINIPGTRVLVDSDALIGLIKEDDLIHERCLRVLDQIQQSNFTLVIPYAIILEAATTLSRKLQLPEKSKQLLEYYLIIKKEDNCDFEVSEFVANLYNPKTSKKNSSFDYYVLALAKKNDIKHIFSFDSFYKKNGLIFIEEII